MPCQNVMKTTPDIRRCQNKGAIEPTSCIETFPNSPLMQRNLGNGRHLQEVAVSAPSM